MAASDQTIQRMLEFKRTPLGLLTNERGSPLLFSDIAERLRLLSSRRETPNARAEVEAALTCRWWGLRVQAIKAIGRWGGAANKAWLMQRAGRPEICDGASGNGKKARRWRTIERYVARRSVARLLDDTDADWLLTLCLEDTSAEINLYPGTTRVSDALFMNWLQSRLPERRGDLRLRLVNMIGQRNRMPGYDSILSGLADGEDKAAYAARQFTAEAKRTIV